MFSVGSSKTQYGQTKFNYFGPSHNVGEKGKQKELASGTFLNFTANNIWDNPGARRVPKKLGRGQGSGKGKTSGRGHKGTYARSGGQINRGFEGGQSTMSKRFPKRGFRSNRFNTME